MKVNKNLSNPKGLTPITPEKREEYRKLVDEIIDSFGKEAVMLGAIDLKSLGWKDNDE